MVGTSSGALFEARLVAISIGAGGVPTAGLCQTTEVEWADGRWSAG